VESEAISGCSKSKLWTRLTCEVRGSFTLRLVLRVDNIDSVMSCTQNPMQRGTPNLPHQIDDDA
ncbi:hypothetical protein K443DRAFT_100000, partial [Laccaria amethystina LaAM-08-1]